MKPLLIVPDPHPRAEQLAQPRLCQQFCARSIATIRPLRIRITRSISADIAEMMRYQHQPRPSRASLRNVSRTPSAPPGPAHWTLVEQELFRPVNQRTRNQNPPLLARRHFTTSCPLKCVASMRSRAFASARSHLRGHMQIRPQREAEKKTCCHRVEPCGYGGTFSWQIGGTTPKCCRNWVRSQRSRPKCAPASPVHHGINLARHRHNQRRLPATVRSQDGHMLTGPHV